MASPKIPSDFLALVSDPSATICGNFINTILKLPTYLASFVAWLLDSSGNISTAVRNQIVRPGDLIFSAAPLAEDATRLLCDGRQVSTTTYAALYAAIGNTWGAGPTAGNFFLPDYRAKFPVGVGLFASGDPVVLGVNVGEEKHALTTLEGGFDKEHGHVVGKFITEGNDNAFFLVEPTRSTDEALQSRKLSGAGTFAQKAITDALIAGDWIVTSDVRPEPSAITGHKTIPPAAGLYIYIST